MTIAYYYQRFCTFATKHYRRLCLLCRAGLVPFQLSVQLKLKKNEE